MVLVVVVVLVVGIGIGRDGVVVGGIEHGVHCGMYRYKRVVASGDYPE